MDGKEAGATLVRSKEEALESVTSGNNRYSSGGTLSPRSIKRISFNADLTRVAPGGSHDITEPLLTTSYRDINSSQPSVWREVSPKEEEVGEESPRK